MPIHNTITGEEAIHQAAYVQTSDPGAVGPYKFWWDTTDGVLKIRNGGDTDWLTLDLLTTAVIFDPSSDQTIEAQSAAITPLKVRGHATQSADLFTVEDNAGTDLVTVGPTGNVTIGPSLSTGTGVSTGDAGIEVASQRTGDGNAYLDLHSESGSDFDLRLIRNAGVNGTGSLRHAGTGTFSLFTNGTARVAIDSTGMVELKNGMKLTGIISPAQLVANQDNWSPTGLAGAAVIRFSTDAARNLTGIVAQASGVRLLLRNVGAFTVTLKHDVTSTAANRFYCPGAADYLLTQKSSVWVTYDATDSRWYVG